MNDANWILRIGSQTLPCNTFPIAYRNAWYAVRKATEAKNGQVGSVMKSISIEGPPNIRNERRKYSYSSATQMATDQGLLDTNGSINSREFKKK